MENQNIQSRVTIPACTTKTACDSSSALEQAQRQENELQTPTSNEFTDSQYQRFTPARKSIITAVLSFCGFLAPMSSTAVLSALPEVADEFGTTGDIISLSNALFMASMALSPLFFGPMSQLYGRRIIMVACAAIFCAASALTAAAPNLAVYFVARIITAFQGTSFLVVGASCLSDVFAPSERATALGWFLSGTTIAPAIAPFLGGVLVTYARWRDIFWLQTGLAGLAVVLLYLFLPETFPNPLISAHSGQGLRVHVSLLAKALNPWAVLVIMYREPTVLLVALASAAVVWNIYSILTPIRYIINPRFQLTSPLQSGLVFLVPGAGSLMGTFLGGRWADRYVRKYMAKRGRRVPEDRLRSCVWSLGVIIPGAILIYGWTIQTEVGGMPVPFIAMFVQGVFQMFCIPSLNTYCLDVLQPQGRSAEAVSCNYLLRYLAAAIDSGTVLPIVSSIGVGWFCVITCGMLILSTVGVLCSIRFGEGWRNRRQSEKPS
ncbi:putative MFS transporter [Hypoxylon cercidicola]|nr:putative MFS transporter [Hypoxylon cercidicola]